MNPRARPQCGQRLYLRTENFGFRVAFTIKDVFAIVLFLSDKRYAFVSSLPRATAQHTLRRPYSFFSRSRLGALTFSERHT